MTFYNKRFNQYSSQITGRTIVAAFFVPVLLLLHHLVGYRTTSSENLPRNIKQREEFDEATAKNKAVSFGSRTCLPTTPLLLPRPCSLFFMASSFACSCSDFQPPAPVRWPSNCQEHTWVSRKYHIHS